MTKPVRSARGRQSGCCQILSRLVYSEVWAALDEARQLRCDMRCGEAVPAEITRLGGSWERPRARMRAKGNRIVGEVEMFPPGTAVVARDADHSGQHCRENVHPTGWRRGDHQRANRRGACDELFEPLSVFLIDRSKAQRHDLRPSPDRPIKARLERSDGGGKTVLEDTDREEFDLWGDRPDDPGKSSTVTQTVAEVVALEDHAFAVLKEGDAAGDGSDVRVLRVDPAVDEREGYARPRGRGEVWVAAAHWRRDCTIVVRRAGLYARSLSGNRGALRRPHAIVSERVFCWGSAPVFQ